MNVHTTIFIFFLLGASGCASPTEPPQDGEPVDAMPPAEGTPISTGGAGALDLNQFSLTECYLTSTSFGWLDDSGPGTYPTGWEPRIEEGIIGSSDYVEILSCRRVAWGGFERPAVLLIETHDKFIAPEGCEWEGSDWMLHKIWTNDAHLAESMTAEFQIPTATASFEATFENSTEVVRLTWSWTSPGADSSDLSTVVLLPTPQDAQLTLGRRYLLDRGNGISTIDLNYTALVPTSYEQFAAGSFDPAMFHASTGVSPYVGAADYWVDASATGVISEFGDYLCEKPL